MSDRSNTPTITVDPPSALIDIAVDIRLHGFGARELVTVRARTTDAARRVYTSAVVVITDANGEVDLSTATPLAGSYLKADSTGLLWSLSPGEDDERDGVGSRFIETGLKPYVVEVHAENEAGTAACADIERLLLDSSVIREDITDPDIVGKLFVPAGEGPFAVVLVVPGSDGGIPESLAALFASHGFAALALAYFGAGDGVPPTLTEIPLEYFGNALDWISRDPRLDPKRVAVNGTSRGGELALLLASRYRQIRAVVAWVPSNHVHPAIGDASATRERAAWTDGGKDLPYLSHQIDQSRRGEFDGEAKCRSVLWIIFAEPPRWSFSRGLRSLLRRSTDPYSSCPGGMTHCGRLRCMETG